MNQTVTTAALIVLTLTAPGLAKLDVGDPAPPLAIAEWIKGKPVDLAKAGKDTVYIIEFWATWCGPCRASIPHLTEIQKHFKDGKLVVVGISNEAVNTVRDFVQSWGARMEYTVAVDDEGETSEKWMEAAGIGGIPHAFLVKGGKIVWHGHPLDGMDDQIVKHTGDKGWMKVVERMAAEREKRMELHAKLREAEANERWDEALKILDQLAAGDEGDPGPRFQKYFLLAARKKDSAAAAEWGAKLLSTLEDASALNEFSWGILTLEELEDQRDLKLALRLAEKANQLAKGKDPSILDTLARAKFDSGEMEAAIELQEKAVSLCKDPDMKESLEKALRTYRKARK